MSPEGVNLIEYRLTPLQVALIEWGKQHPYGKIREDYRLGRVNVQIVSIRRIVMANIYIKRTVQGRELIAHIEDGKIIGVKPWIGTLVEATSDDVLSIIIWLLKIFSELN